MECLLRLLCELVSGVNAMSYPCGSRASSNDESMVCDCLNLLGGESDANSVSSWVE